MHAASRTEPRLDTFEHQTHAGVEWTQHRHFALRHQTGVGMRQEARIDREFAGASDILDSAADTELLVRRAILLERDFRFVAQTHQRFFATELRAAPRP